MRRAIAISICLFGLLAVGMGAIGTTQDDGMRGFFGRADVIQGIVEIDHGTGTNQPGYVRIESCDGTGLYLFVDNDGYMRQDTSVPTADTSGANLWHIRDVNNVTADLVTYAGSDLYIISSNTAGITGTFADGTVVGEIVTFVCKVAGNNIDITVEHHVTSDPEVIQLNAAKDLVSLVWDGTDWVEIDAVSLVYP